MSCSPSYPYAPNFTPSNVSCAAPVYETHRSRLTTPGSSQASALFFRSRRQANDTNEIEIEIAPTTMMVYSGGTLVSSYPVTMGTGGIAALRAAVTSDSSAIIEMPDVGVDIYDLRGIESDGDGILEPGLSPVARSSLTGGAGAPEDAVGLANIRTGPQRTMYIVRSIEDFDGSDVFPPPSEKIKQWNGEEWISYCNNVPGACPGEGTC